MHAKICSPGPACEGSVARSARKGLANGACWPEGCSQGLLARVRSSWLARRGLPARSCKPPGLARQVAAFARAEGREAAREGLRGEELLARARAPGFTRWAVLVGTRPLGAPARAGLPAATICQAAAAAAARASPVGPARQSSLPGACPPGSAPAGLSPGPFRRVMSRRVSLSRAACQQVLPSHSAPARAWPREGLLARVGPRRFARQGLPAGVFAWPRVCSGAYDKRAPSVSSISR